MTQLPLYIDAEVWATYVEVRKAMKKHPFTPLVAKRMIQKLMRLHAEGFDPNALLERSAINGWRDVFPDEKMKIGKDVPKKDPALVKIEQDDLKAAPMPSYIRELKERLVR